MTAHDHRMHVSRWALAALVGLGLVTAMGCNGDRNNAAASGSGAGTTDDGGSDAPVDATSATSAVESEESGGTCRAPQTGGYNDCVNNSASACDHDEASCLVNVLMEPVWGVCFLRCEEDCDCWGMPADGTAEPRCAEVLSEGGSACILDCADDRSCPAGMRCLGLNGVTRACVFDVEGLGTTGETSSSDDADGDSDGEGSGSSSEGSSTGETSSTDDGASSSTGSSSSSGSTGV